MPVLSAKNAVCTIPPGSCAMTENISIFGTVPRTPVLKYCVVFFLLQRYWPWKHIIYEKCHLNSIVHEVLLVYMYEKNIYIYKEGIIRMRICNIKHSLMESQNKFTRLSWQSCVRHLTASFIRTNFYTTKRFIVAHFCMCYSLKLG